MNLQHTKLVKKHLAIVTILASAIFLGGITGCSSFKSSDASTKDTSGANVSQTSVPEADSSARSQRREEVRKQIEAVLTPDQVKQLQEKLQQGEKMRKALYSLNLSEEQKTKIQTILKSNYTHRQR